MTALERFQFVVLLFGAGTLFGMAEMMGGVLLYPSFDFTAYLPTVKEVVAELTLENRLLKKSVTADGEDAA